MDDDDARFFKNKRSDRFFVGSRFNAGFNMRIASEIVEGDDRQFASVRDEVVLRVTNNRRFELKATFSEDDRGIGVLTIQRWNVDKNRPHEKTSFSFVDAEIPRLLEFVERVRTIHFDGPGPVNAAISDLQKVTLTPEQQRQLVSGRQDLVIEIATHEVTQQDIVALAYRRAQLERFERLLSDAQFFADERKRLGETPEGVWQAYFEANPWVFGHGLSYVFMSGLEGRALEQVVKGFDVTGPGKRGDGLMKTHAHLSSVCLVEIKRHDTALLKPKPYRSGAWPASDELIGGIAQVHETVRVAAESFKGRFRPTDEFGDPTGEDLLSVHPRSYLVIGSLEEFSSERGLNEAKFRSFETLRRSLHQPEILTFDELLYRARFIVDAQASAPPPEPPVEAPTDSGADWDDIPF